MNNDQAFVDYYARLQVTPACDSKMVEKAYRHFAQLYHPDHPETADVDRFQETIEAYDILRDPVKRAKYDKVYRAERGMGSQHFTRFDEVRIDEDAAILDAEQHEKILFQLYRQRRENASDPGVIGYNIQQMLGCSDENFEFHVWYLKSKGFLTMTEHGTLAITIEGVDHVISMSRTIEAEKKLLTSRPDRDEE